MGFSMVNMKKVSIIVPIYNTEEYLPRCIDSILNQRYSNIELILVDDGSTDKSPKICDDYANKDKRIKVIHKTNGGVSSARNSGLDIASGEYITFVDSDDYITNSFSEVCERLDNQDIVISDEACKRKSIKRKINRVGDKGCDCTFNFLLKNNSIIQINPVWNKIFHKNIIRNLKFNERVMVIEDLDYVIRALFLSQKIELIPINYYFYSLRTTSAMHDNSVIAIESVINSGKELISYYQKYYDNKRWRKQIISLVSESIMYAIYVRFKDYTGKPEKETLDLIKKNLNLLSHVKRVKFKLLYVFIKIFGVKLSIKLYSLLGRRQNLAVYGV